MRLSLILLILFASIQSFAQAEKKLLTGKVNDTQGAIIPYANVLVFSEIDSALIDGTTTDENGRYELEIVPGKYYLRIRFLSYHEFFVYGIEITTESIELEPILLVPKDAVLGTVDITIEKPQMELKLDKRIFNVQQDISSAGLNGAEILDNIPSISVDSEGNVSLRGSQNVRILINGKPSTLSGMSNTDLLRQIDGSMIERVEVITNPSARYDAEGEVGIINIVLKNEMKTGFNGSINARVNYPLGYGAGFNLNYRTKTINYFLGYSYGLNRSPGSGQNTQRFNSPDTSYSYEQFSNHDRGGYSQNLQGGLDIITGKQSSITLSANLRSSNGTNWNEIEYNDYDSLGTLTQVVFRNEDERDQSSAQEYNLNFRKSFSKAERLFTFDVKKSFSIDRETSDLEEISSDAFDPTIFQLTVSDEAEQSWLFQTDYIHPFGKEGKFETGAKVSLRNLTNDYSLEDSLNGGWVINPLFNNYLEYTENIYAAYIMGGNKIKKFSFQGGLRGELSDVTTNLVETNELNRRTYFQVFPSVHFSYELKNNAFIQLSYSRRISRPRQWWLTPFYTFRDSRNFESGNPNLDPEFAGSYELGHLKYSKKGSILSSFYFRRTTDVMERIVITDSLGNTWRLPVNLGYRNAFGIEFSGSYELTKWWSMNGSFNFYRAISEGEYEGVVYSNDAYAWSSKATSKFSPGKKLSLQTSFTFDSPSKTNQGSVRAQYFWDTSAAIDLFSGNGTLSFNARDILNSRKRRTIIESDYFYSEGYFQWRSRQFTLSFVYRINQNKSKNERNEFGGDSDTGM